MKALSQRPKFMGLEGTPEIASRTLNLQAEQLLSHAKANWPLAPVLFAGFPEQIRPKSPASFPSPSC